MVRPLCCGLLGTGGGRGLTTELWYTQTVGSTPYAVIVGRLKPRHGYVVWCAVAPSWRVALPGMVLCASGRGGCAFMRPAGRFSVAHAQMWVQRHPVPHTRHPMAML